ncbi:hypothetical protein HYC85_013159 [Camellia sinensis]|uniref:ABC transporter domain-containing protein n=1 Tax=Camellia sinensis TaxID=4442 RepID=A0A7J7H2M1_CAMSI|nr:hypothetical protein HYC85_013159 [Camellia sinensis]
MSKLVANVVIAGLTGMALSYERLEQYMHIPSEAPEIIQCNQPVLNWPTIGRVEIHDLKVRYWPNAPLVLQGISYIFGGNKIGIVGRTGSGKTTLINVLFRLVEPTERTIFIDDLNISTIGFHDLRSHFGVIPQEPTLFSGSVRYNLDPLLELTDKEIWEVLEKCQLRKAIQKKEEGLYSLAHSLAVFTLKRMEIEPEKHGYNKDSLVGDSEVAFSSCLNFKELRGKLWRCKQMEGGYET